MSVHERMATLMTHVPDIDRGLSGAVGANAASGSLQRMFVPAVRDFAALGAGSEKEIPDTPAVDDVERPDLPLPKVVAHALRARTTNSMSQSRTCSKDSI